MSPGFPQWSSAQLVKLGDPEELSRSSAWRLCCWERSSKTTFDLLSCSQACFLCVPRSPGVALGTMLSLKHEIGVLLMPPSEEGSWGVHLS